MPTTTLGANKRSLTSASSIIPQTQEEKQVANYTVLKKMNTYFAAGLDRIGEHKAAMRALDCGRELTFATVDGRSRLIHAQFCRDRMCPICVFNASRKCYRELSTAMERLPNRYLFLTLTVRSCGAAEIGHTLDQIFSGWNRFTASKGMKKRFPGWFRALEITYNPRSDTYHPHLHIVLAAADDYFDGGYIDWSAWVIKWRKFARLDYDPVVHIQSAKPKRKDLIAVTDKDAEHAIAIRDAAKEAAKYATKATDYLPPEAYGADDSSSDPQLKAIREGLKGRRIHAYGGILADARKEAEKEYEEETKAMRDDLEAVVTTYRWFVGARTYTQINEETRIVSMTD